MFKLKTLSYIITFLDKTQTVYYPVKITYKTCIQITLQYDIQGIDHI